MGSLKASLIALGLCATFLLHAEQSPAAEAFAKMSKLTGSWKGTVQWSGARQDSGDMNATYYVKLFSNLKWNASFYGNWDSRPPNGLSGSDYGSTSGLSWTYGLK